MLKFEYGEGADIITIEGIKYCGELFRKLGGFMPLNERFTIVKREDGVLTIMSAPQEPTHG